jgi:hypothetical protein
MTMTKKTRSTFFLIAVLALAITMALLGWPILPAGRQTARADTGGFSGQVIELLTGQPIPGAQVSAGDAQAITDGNGRYTLRVAPGIYEIHARAEGYIGMSKTRQTAHEATISTVDFEMVVTSPSPEERIALDKIFRPSGGPELTMEELEAARARTLTLAGVTHLPATIRVLMPDGVVVVMSLDEYVKGVVPREMAPYWPMEALKAQAVAARCYAANARRHADAGADVCTTVHCQAWGPIHYETTDRAVDETHSVAVTYAGNIINAFYFGHCDGHTKNSEDVWTVPLPYCRSVPCPADYESFFGHGVGMCQQGARVLAESGKTYTEILMHYYTDVQVTGLPAHTLANGRVTPEEGDTATVFTFEVLYTSHDPPIAAHLYIDGYTHSMSAVAHTVQGGTLYRYSTMLPVGTHTYAFHFENGYDPPVNLPASGTLSGPTVQTRDVHLPTPTPQPTPAGTHARQWTQSTLTDFADGTHYGMVLTSEGDGEVALASDRTSGVYTSTVKLTPIEFAAIGSAWQATTPAGTAITIALRSSTDGTNWSDWAVIPPMDAEREEALLSYGELLYLRGPYVQYRLTFASYQAGIRPVLRSITLTFIDSRAGPTAEQAQAVAISIAIPGQPVIIPRSAWGADESWFNWPPEYRAPRKFIIHHTVTPNDDLDPAATVRAIYYYHAVTRGWGDIGYNYLIDTQGRIYEGRKGGEGVVGGHAKQYAWGSIGISLLGNYEEVDVPALMENSLVEMLAWRGNLHFIHPTGHDFFIDKHLPNVMGHRDVAQTTCPGQYAYARLPTVRQTALERMADLPPNVRIDEPSADAQVSGVVNLTATASPAVTVVEFYVDGALRASDASASFSWKWNTTTAGNGPHRLRVQARTAIGLVAEQKITVTVDNKAPSGSLSGPTFSNVPSVTLTTWADDAQWMQFSNGWHWEGEELRHQTGSQVSDTAAWNGQAWMGRAGSDGEGWWYGPYLQELPTGRSYRVYFRLKTADNGTAAAVANIDVTDDFGRNTYVNQTLAGQDFAGRLSYQEPYLDFNYYRHDTYGLEFRTFYTGQSDLYLDRVYLFRAPRSYAGSMEWVLPEGDGPKEVAARYIDAAGNVSAVYSTTVILDTEPPQWLDWDGAQAQVRDELSGLQVHSAQFATSMDSSLTWGEWQPATITATEGTTASVSISAPTNGATHLRFRVADRANNLAQSPVYSLPTPTPTFTSSPTPTATATPSPTATPGFGQIRGRVTLQGRSEHDGVTVSISEVITVTTSEDGSYMLGELFSGSYTVTVRMPAYLEAYREGVTVSVGTETTLPDVTLRGGDVNGDCSVNLFDLVMVASNFGSSPGDHRADINADGTVDIRDLVLAAVNYGKRCPSDW